jgi:hypothetical protein
MIDYFAIGLTHALIVLAAIRLLSRADLDDEDAGGEAAPSADEGGSPRMPRRKSRGRKPGQARAR